MVRREKEERNFGPAPLRRKKLEEAVANARLSEHLTERLRLLTENNQKVFDKSKYGAYNRGTLNYIKSSHANISKDLYYMLMPSYVQPLTKTISSAQNLLQSVVLEAQKINLDRNVPIPEQQMKGLKGLVDYRNALKNGEDNPRTVTAFDIETVGGGVDEYGLERIHGIYDYSFLNMDGEGNAKKYTGLIGIQQGSNSHQFLTGIVDKVKKNEQLSKTESTAYEFISRLGASDEFIKKENGKWISTNLTSKTKQEFQNVENFSKGIDILVNKVGSDQFNEYGQLGGFKQFIDDIADHINNPDNTMFGHNIHRFDIPKITRTILSVPGAKEYAKSKGVDFNSLFRDSYDALSAVRMLKPKDRIKLEDKIYPVGFSAGGYTGTPWQAENIHKGLFGENDDVHHGTMVDSTQSAEISGLHIDENGRVKVIPNAFTKMEDKLANRAFDYHTDADINKQVEDIFNGTSDAKMYVVPKVNGGLYGLSTDSSMYAISTNGKQVYYSDGVMGVLGVDKKGNQVLTNVQEETDFFPAMWNDRTIYSVNNVQYIERNDASKGFFDQIGRGRQGFEHTQGVVAIQLNPFSLEKEKYLEKTKYSTTIYLPIEEAERKLSESINIIGVDNKDGVPVLTSVGEEFSKKVFRSNAGDTSIIAKEQVEKPKSKTLTALMEEIGGSFERKTAENAGRGIDQGHFSSLEKGIALAEISNANPAQLHIDKLREYIELIQSNPSEVNIKEFQDVLKGVKLNKDTEKFVNTVLGGGYRDVRTWQNLFKINGAYNGGWADNSYLFAKSINLNSPGVAWIKSWGGGKHTGDDIIKMRSGLGYLASTFYGSNVAMGMGYIGDWRIDDGTMMFNMSNYQKRRGVKNVRLDSGFINLKTSDPYKVLNSIYKASNTDINGLDEVGKVDIVKEFINSLIDENDEVLTKSKTRMQQLLAKKKKLSPLEIVERFTSILNEYESDNTELKPITIPQPNMARSFVFKYPNAAEENKDIVSSLRDRVDVSVKAFKDPKGTINRFSFGDNDETSIIKDYQKQIKELKNSDGDAYGKRLNLFQQQVSSVKKYNETLIDSIKKSGGQIYKNDNGKIMVSFGGEAIDITECIPKLKASGGASYTSLNGVSYATTLTGELDANGVWKIETAIDKGTEKLRWLQKELGEAEATGKRKEAIVSRIVTQAKEAIRNNDILAASLQKDYRTNTYISIEDAFINPKKRKNIVNYLKGLKTEKADVKRIISALDSDQEKIMLTEAVRSSIINLFSDGTIKTEAKFGDQTYRFGTELKDTALSKMNVSAMPTYRSANDLNENVASSSLHVEESSVTLKADRLGKYYSPENIQTSDDVVNNKIGEEQVTSGISLKAREINNGDKIRLIDEAEKRGTINSKLARRFNAMLNPTEGGAAIVGSVLEKSGYREGRKIAPITEETTQEAFKDSIELNKETGKYELKYGRGKFYKANDTFISQFSQFDEETTKETSRPSIVAEKYLLGEGRDIVLNQNEVDDIVYKNANRILGRDIQSAEDYRKIADTLLNKRLVAEPVVLPTNLKTKNLTTSGKHETAIVYTKLNDIKDARITDFLNSNAIKRLQKATGIDFGNAYLAKEIYDDIAQNKLENPIFDLIEENKTFLQELLGTEKIVAEDGTIIETLDPISEVMRQQRNTIENAFKVTFGAEYVSQEFKDMYKHGEVNKEFLKTYNDLVSKFVDEGSDIKEAANRAVSKIKHAVEFEDGKDIRIRDDGSIQLPENGYGVNFDKLAEVRARNGLEVIGKDGFYDAKIGIQKVPTEFDKKPKFDDRTLRTLTSQIWDQDEMERVYSNMIRDGKEEEFFQTFGDVIDKNEKSKLGWEVKKDLQGQTLWGKDFNAAYARTFVDGETVFNPEMLDATDRQINIYNRTINDIGQKVPVSKEYIEDIIHGEDIIAGQKLSKAIFEGREDVAKDVANRYGFKRAKANEVAWDYKGNRIGFVNNPDALWKNNYVVDFTDKDLGLDEAFLRNYTDTGTGEIAIPGRAPRFTADDVKNKPFGDIELKEYQSKAQNIFRKREELKSLLAIQQKGEFNSDDDRRLLEEKIKSTRNSIGTAIEEYNSSYANYMKASLKENGVMGNRIHSRVDMANRSLSYVFDTNSWTMKNDRNEWTLRDEIDPFSKFKYNGKSLKESYREGNKVGFAVASTADLSKYGFTDKYFKDLGISKNQWLKRAKTEGVDIFIHRDPNDYHRSTVAARLYFSDDVTKGSILTSDILAHGMKQDADGDSVAAYILGSRGRNGKFVDANSLAMLSDEKVDYLDAQLRAQRLQDIHSKSMLMDTYGEFTSKQYQDLGVENQLALPEYNKNITNEERAKALANSINKTVYVRSKDYGDTDTINGLRSDWEKSKIQMTSAIQAQSPDLDMSTLLDNDYKQYAKKFIEDSANAANFSKEELNVIKKGVKSYQALMEARAVHFTRNMRIGIGEIDVPFTTINMLAQNLRNPKLGDIFGDAAQNMRLTSRDIKALDFLQEAAKEGFLSAKHSDADKLAGYAELVSTTKSAIEDIVRNTDPDKVNAASEQLQNNLFKFGKVVNDRNDIEIIIDPNIADRLMKQYASDQNSLKQKMYEEAITTGVNALKKTVSILKPELRSQGLFPVREALINQALKNLLNNTINGQEPNKEQLEFLKSNGFDSLVDMAEGMIRDQQGNVENMARNVKTSNQVRNTAKMEYRDVMQYAKSISGGKPSGSGLALAVAGLAGTILFTGYVGGNPSVPSGEEAMRTNQNRPNPTISPIPTQNPSSINAMRNGPRQGYIINVRGSSGSSNDYIGEAISKAVRQNYSNTQVNINLQTQEQNDITYDQVYDYMQQALF